MNTDSIKLALVGSPNCGKTTLFNALTGGHQHVGNYSGVTVERHVGTILLPEPVEITDLPGTYSLCAVSEDEAVVQRTLLNERFDLLVNVIDSARLNRNLYLTLQLFTFRLPVLLVLNMTDEADASGLTIDAQKLARLTGLPVVKTNGRTGKGIPELKEAIKAALREKKTAALPDWKHQGDDHLRTCITELAAKIKALPNPFKADVAPEWVAIKLLEDDPHVAGYFPDLVRVAAQQRALLEQAEGDSADVVIADFRRGITNALTRDCQALPPVSRNDRTAMIDRVLTHRVWGLPLFFAFMYAMFSLTFTLGEPLMGGLEFLFAHLRGPFEAMVPAAAPEWVGALLIGGIYDGVCGVLVFLPNILILFLCLSLIEATGYMARAAFIMDRAMRTVGLHGKSFIPLLVGFGCTVPAIMATRTIESRRDRLITQFIAPLMSCGARLPVYTLVIAALFPLAYQGAVMFSVYFIGVLAALAIAAIVSRTAFPDDGSAFILELPPYRLPTLRSTFIHMWGRAAMYLRKAGTLILGASILLWFASEYPKGVDGRGEERKPLSVQIGEFMEPAMRQIGFDRDISIALVGAFAAKEVVVTQLAIATRTEEDEASGNKSLREILAKRYTPLQGYLLMLFVLIATPCVATFAAMKKETGGWFWAIAQQVTLTVLAYGICFVLWHIFK